MHTSLQGISSQALTSYLLGESDTLVDKRCNMVMLGAGVLLGLAGAKAVYDNRAQNGQPLTKEQKNKMAIGVLLLATGGALGWCSRR